MMPGQSVRREVAVDVWGWVGVEIQEERNRQFG